MKGVAQMADEKSNEEKAAEIVAEAIRDRLTLPDSAKRGQPDENVVEVLSGIYSELRRIAEALEEANSWRASQ
jgi:hypothetical protein